MAESLMAVKSHIQHIAEVVLRVSNLKKMVEFYQKVLGFGVVHRAPDIVFLKIADLDSPLGHGGHAQLLGLVDRHIALDTMHAAYDHLAFEVAIEDFESEKKRLERLGLEVRTREYAWSHARALFFHDPDGNLVELICHDDSVG